MAVDHSRTDTNAGSEYDVVRALGQEIHVDRGEVFENKLFDVSTGNSVHLRITGADSVVRNVGFAGLYGGDEYLLSIDAGPGTVRVENVYMGDGASKDGAGSVQGAGGVVLDGGNEADVTFRHCNVQGFPNNGFHCSSTADGPGSVHFDSCFGKNNGVATFRCAGSDDLLENCVAYTDTTNYGHGDDDYLVSNARPVWVWHGGPVTIRDSHLGDGPYPHAIVAGAHDFPGQVDFESGAYSGTIQCTSGSTVDVGRDVSTDPDLSVPSGVPRSAREAIESKDRHEATNCDVDDCQRRFPHAIVFDGREADEPSSYSFTATSAIQASRKRPSDEPDVVREQPVSGTVDGASVKYWFDGDVESLSMRGDATVTIRYDAREGAETDSRIPW